MRPQPPTFRTIGLASRFARRMPLTAPSRKIAPPQVGWSWYDCNCYREQFARLQPSTMAVPIITSPDDPALDELCQRLSASADEIDRSGTLAGRSAEAVRRSRRISTGFWNRSTVDKAGVPKTRFVATWRSPRRASRRRSFSRSGPAPAGVSPASANEDLQRRLLPGLASGDVVLDDRHFAPHNQPSSSGPTGSCG